MSKSIAVFGIGRFGRSLALTLSESGADVMVVDGDENVKAWTAGGTKIGRLSKGKIHCSCWMCRVKSYDYRSHMDARRIQGMTDEEREWR